ncbi:hypothetical protein ACCI51_18205 [Microbulbifer echini]|uniref:Uncharacterized protein n=1 Tax=Microbulbifer echini TaxID=1529067 RepID=A0ABV4NTF4_9GAMM
MNEEFETIKDQLAGLELSYAWRGHGSAIFLEFGKLDHNTGKNNPIGEFSLMLDCEWRIENSNQILCGSYRSHDEIEKEIHGLVGDQLVNLEFMGNLPEISIALASQKYVVSFTSDVGDPEWGLRLPSGSWLCSKGGSVVLDKRA